MKNIPAYNADENLRRIKYQKKHKFIVVEGSDDVPIYESCLHYLTSNKEYDVIFSGGKTKIRTFLESNKHTNAMFIIDKDFNDIGISDHRLISLLRYSIENYFICKEVIAHNLQFIFGCNRKDINEAFSLDEFINVTNNDIATLIKVIFYYQRVITPQLKDSNEECIAWSDYFICQDKNWRLCQQKILKLIDDLTADKFTITEASVYFEANFSSCGIITFDFPGKLLKHSLQRFIRNEIISIKPDANGKFNSVEDMRILLSSSMHQSPALREVLIPVVQFVNA